MPRKAANPVALALGEKAVFLGTNWRMIAAVPGGKPAYKSLPLLMTSPGRYSWLEDEQPRTYSGSWARLITTPRFARSRDSATIRARSQPSRPRASPVAWLPSVTA